MPNIELSTGLSIRPEHIERAEYYPPEAFRQYGCHFGGPEMRDCPFLFIQMRNGMERISGSHAAEDAQALEDAGIRVIRHPAGTPASVRSGCYARGSRGSESVDVNPEP